MTSTIVAIVVSPTTPTTPANRPRLAVDDLSVHFGPRPALADLTVSFNRGEMVSLLGPNGAGKSTLLRVLAGMLPPSHGSVHFDGRPVRRPCREVVYVPQRAGAEWTFPVSVLDVALMGVTSRRPRLLPLSSHARARAVAALETVGMRELAGVQIGALSGGQQQRVFIARALLAEGDVYLLDEPFSGVDIPTQALLLDVFGRLRGDGKTIIYATHDIAQAQTSSDRVLLINRHLIAAGPPAAVMTEANLRAAFGGQVVVIAGSEGATGQGGWS